MKNNYKKQYPPDRLEDIIITIKNFEKNSITQNRLENNKADIMSNISSIKITHTKPFLRSLALVASIAFVVLFSGILLFINKSSSDVQITINEEKDMNITNFVIGNLFSSIYNNNYDENNMYTEAEKWVDYDEIRQSFDISSNFISDIDVKNISFNKLETNNISYIDIIMSDYETSFNFIDVF